MEMPTSPLPFSAKLHRQGQRLWRFIKSLYYASTPSWQLLKSGALFFFGFFCWAVGNLLHAFLPGVYWPNLLIVYGALLFWFGPLTHLVLVPHVIPWLRRRRQHHVLYWLGGALYGHHAHIVFCNGWSFEREPARLYGDGRAGAFIQYYPAGYHRTSGSAT